MKRKVCLLALKPYGLYVNGADLSNALLFKRLHEDGYNIAVGVLLDQYLPQAKVYERFLHSLVKGKSSHENPISYLAQKSLLHVQKEAITCPYPISYTHLPVLAYKQFFTGVGKLLDRLKPDLVLTSDIFTAYIAVRLGLKPIFYNHNNDLLPSPHGLPVLMNDAEIRETLKKCHVLTVSQFVVRDMKKNWGVNAFVLPPIIEPRMCKTKQLSPKFVGLMTYAPQKGGMIFHAVAKKLRNLSFLGVKSWHPDYQNLLTARLPPLPNLKFAAGLRCP